MLTTTLGSMHFFCIALFGAVMLSLSLIFGHDHEVVDHDADGDGDHDADDHGDGNGSLSIFSFKIIMMFLTGFGAGGYFGIRAGFGPMGGSLWGVLAGFVMGALGWVLMNYLYKHQGNSTVKTASVIGETAVVDTEIPANGLGEVYCLANGRMEYFQARSADGVRIPKSVIVTVKTTAGAVLVVEVRN